MTSHTKRLITAFTIIPVLVVILSRAPNWAFTVLTLMVALISLYEYYTLTGSAGAKQITFFTYFLTVAVFLSTLGYAPLSIALFSFFVIIPLIVSLFDVSKNHSTIGTIGKIILGPFYICLPLMLLAMVAMLSQGRTWVFFLLTVIFIGDTGSFYCGKRFGKHKLTRISPGKTWEGSVGGVLANAASSCLFGVLFFPSLSLVSLMVLAIGMGIVGQFGDLAESMLKRMSNTKDSGTILPGHGGMLDRIDSLLFAIPVLYLYVNYQKFY